MLHRSNPPMTIDSLRGIIEELQNKAMNAKAAIGQH
jgi:hypothetical protein